MKSLAKNLWRYNMKRQSKSSNIGVGLALAALVSAFTLTSIGSSEAATHMSASNGRYVQVWGNNLEVPNSLTGQRQIDVWGHEIELPR